MTIDNFESGGSVGAQHEIKEKLVDLMGTEKTEEFFKKWRENHFTKIDVDSLASWGFNSIRVPLHYNLFTLPIQEEPVSGENTWLDEGFNIVDDVLEWAKPHNMYVILDLHVKIMSDRIIVLKDGQIVDENPTNNLFKNPKKYTKKLIDAII